MKKLPGLGIYLPDGERHFTLPDPKKRGRPVAFDYQVDRLKKAYPMVRDWNMAVDVGGHVGLLAIKFAERFRMVHTFEPCPVNFECLVANTQHLPNVFRHPFALGERPGQVGMRLEADNSGNHQIVPEGTGVEMRTLDEMQLPALDLLKVDVQGYEYFVLKGGRRTIERFRPVCIIECEESYKLKEHYDLPFRKAVDFLMKLGARLRHQVCEDYILTF